MARFSFISTLPFIFLVIIYIQYSFSAPSVKSKHKYKKKLINTFRENAELIEIVQGKNEHGCNKGQSAYVQDVRSPNLKLGEVKKKKKLLKNIRFF